jgi:Histidine kinase-, DNA gyrase B-, and HSP90-like ATPase
VEGVEGPYRDLGSGFARLTGAEGARRHPSPLRCVEDALLELLRNSRDAGAHSVFIASTLKHRRYRTLTVLDDGVGIPETHRALIFEPGVTSRHLSPVLDHPREAPHGAGLSLYHIKKAATRAEVLSTSAPTAVKTTFDTHTLPERTLQSTSRPSRTNLLGTLQTFATTSEIKLYYASPSRTLATLLQNHILHPPATVAAMHEAAGRLGLEVSLRTARRVWRGEIAPVGNVVEGSITRMEKSKGAMAMSEGPVLALGEEERSDIADILRRAAGASYLEVGELELRTRPGEISVRARVYEPEEEYE